MPPLFFFGILWSFIEIELTYTVMIISAVWQRNSVIHIHTPSLFSVFSHIDYHKILGRVPCAIQQVPTGQSCHMHQCAYANPSWWQEWIHSMSCILTYWVPHLCHHSFDWECWAWTLDSMQISHPHANGTVLTSLIISMSAWLIYAHSSLEVNSMEPLAFVSS